MRAACAVMSVVVVACGCVALAGCGDGGRSATDESPSPSAGTKSGLGAERFRALDAVYATLPAFDALGGDREGPIDDAQLTAATGPAIAACEALDPEDPLLGPLRDGCPLVAEFSERVAGLDDCSAADDPNACPALVDSMRRTLSRLDRLGHRSDRAIRRAQLTPACRRALLTPGRAFRAYDGYVRALRLLSSPRTADTAAARRALAAADALADTLPDGRISLQRFRSACA